MSRRRGFVPAERGGCSDPRPMVAHLYPVRGALVVCDTCHEVWMTEPRFAYEGPLSPVQTAAVDRYEAWMAAD